MSTHFLDGAAYVPAQAPRPGSLQSLEQLDPPAMREKRGELAAALRQAGAVHAPGVLEAIRRVPRHLFVPASLAPHAYDDRPLAIGHDQTISQPTIVGVMTQALHLTGRERVLEIGTGSGYQAAVLSSLAHTVYSIERIEALGAAARELLHYLGYANVRVVVGDGHLGMPEEAPFDRVILTAAPTHIPRALVAQLADGGILVAPVGAEGGQLLVRGRKLDGTIRFESLGPVSFVPMLGEEPEWT